MKDPIFQLALFLAYATIAAVFIQGLFFPVRNSSIKAKGVANDSKPLHSNTSAPSSPNQSVLHGWRKSRWFWYISQFLFVLSLKIVTVIVLVSLKVDIANDATSLLPILLNVWLSRYLVFQKKLNMSRWLIGGTIYFVQVLLGLTIGVIPL